MPEIGEVACIVHYLRKHLVNRTLSTVTAQHDESVYGKVGTSAAEFQKALTGKKVVGSGQQGKYFWLVMSSPPHPLMHFGMTGWLKIKNEETYYYKNKKGEEEEWPPKYWKFMLETKEEPKTEAAFVDFRRFSRIRLLDCEAGDIRNVSPLKENGPDPVVDKDVLTEEWFVKKCRAKKIPIKALLLDQANISGIGNWVGDEIMYHAKIHPEQYSNTLTDAQLKQLHASIHHICSTAVDLLADPDKFPEEWLFKHRWGKGKKDQAKTLPNGEKIVFLTVGGRTSAVIPSVQKKTGPVAKDVSKEDLEDADDEEKVVTNGTASKQKPDKKQPDVKEDIQDEKPTTKQKGRKRKSMEDETSNETAKTEAANKKAKVNGNNTKPSTKRKKVDAEPKKEVSSGGRRSTRISS